MAHDPEEQGGDPLAGLPPDQVERAIVRLADAGRLPLVVRDGQVLVPPVTPSDEQT